MVKVKERKTDYNHGIYIRLLNRFNDLANELLNKIDFRDLVKPLDLNAPQDIEFQYFTHRYDAGKILEKLAAKKQLQNKSVAFTLLTSKITEVQKKDATFELPPPTKELKKAPTKDTSAITGPLSNLSEKLKGRILQNLSKKIVTGTRLYFARWYVRTHKEHATECAHRFVIKSKLSVQVSYWRFTWLTRHLNKKKDDKYDKLCHWQVNKEARQHTLKTRGAFNKLKCGFDMAVQARMFKAVDNLCAIVDERIAKNLNTLENESDMLGNSDIMMKLKTALMGKYRYCLQLLREHNFRSKMQETLSDEIMKKLMDRLVNGVSKANTDLKNVAYHMLRKHNQFEIKKRSICRRVIDSNFRLMAAGFNKLVQDAKARGEALENKVRFIINSLRDKDISASSMAYYQMKRFKDMLMGVGMSDSSKLKKRIIRKLMDKGYDWMDSCFHELKRVAAQLAEKDERDRTTKERFLKRFMYSNLREQGQGLRMLRVNKDEEEAKEQARMKRYRGIMNRMQDVNTRWMSAGYNKLIEEYKIYMDNLKNRLKFVIQSLKNTELRNSMMAYNMLKESKLAQDGVGVDRAVEKKKQLIKALMNQGFAQQVAGIRSLKMFLVKQKALDKEKANILKRMMDKGLREQGQCLRMLKVHKDMEIEREKRLALKQRGVCKMMLDANVRLMLAGYNKLRDEYRLKVNGLKDKLKFVIKALTDKDANFILMAYNAMKRHRDAIVHGGEYRVGRLKENFIKRLLNTSYNWQFMAMEKLREYMKYLAHIEGLKKKAAIRMSSASLRLMGQGLRCLQVFAKMAAEDQERLGDKQKGVCRRMLDQNVRLMGMAWVNLYDNYQVRHELAKAKIKQIVECLRNKDLMFVQMAYQGLKTQMLMLRGVGLSEAEHKKNLLMRRLRDTGLNLSLSAIQTLKEFLKDARAQDEWEEAELKRLEAEKERVLKLIMNSNLRLMFAGYNQLYDYLKVSRDNEQKLMARQRGIAKRIFSSQTRLMAQAMNSLKDFANKDDKTKKRTLMRIMDVNYRNMAGGWRMIMHFNNMMVAEEERLNNLRRNIVFRMTDKANNLCASAFAIMQKWNENKKVKEKAMIMRMIDSNFRLLGMAYNKLVAASQQTQNMMKSFANRLLNANLNVMAQGFRNLKENSWIAADAETRLADKQRGAILRMMNSGYRLMGGCLTYLKSMNQVMAETEAKNDNTIKGFMNRMMNANVRLCGMALNALKAHNSQINQDSARNERLMKRFIGFCQNSNFRLLLAGYNKLQEHYKILSQDALVHKNIEDMKNSLMGGMAKTRAKHELRITGMFFNDLVKWRNLMDLKDRAVKRFVNAALGKGDALKRFGIQTLRVFNLRIKVFQRACKLVTTLGRSANRYQKVHNLFYKMLVNAVYKNPWHQKFLDAMVFNSTSEFHISFWKLKRIG